MAQPDDYQRFYDNVRQHAVGALVTAIQAELFETLRDFCQHTNAYNQYQDIVVSGASQTYPLTTPGGTAIKRVLSMRDITNGDGEPFIGVRWPVVLVLPNTLQLNQVLSNTYTWRVQTTLYPVDPVDADGNPIVPSWIVDDYFDTLFSGTLFRMFTQKAKPYSDVQMAASRYRLYLKGRGEATAAVLQANMYGGQAWAYPQGGIVSGRQRGV